MLETIALSKASAHEKELIIENVLYKYELNRSLIQSEETGDLIYSLNGKHLTLDARWELISQYLLNKSNAKRRLHQIFVAEIKDASFLIENAHINITKIGEWDITDFLLLNEAHKTKLINLCLKKYKTISDKNRNLASLELLKFLSDETLIIDFKWEKILAYCSNQNNHTSNLYSTIINSFESIPALYNNQAIEYLENNNTKTAYIFFCLSFHTARKIKLPNTNEILKNSLQALKKLIKTGNFSSDICLATNPDIKNYKKAHFLGSFLPADIQSLLIINITIVLIIPFNITSCIHGLFRSLSRKPLSPFLISQTLEKLSLFSKPENTRAQENVIKTVCAMYEEVKHITRSNSSKTLFDQIKDNRLSNETKWEKIIDYMTENETENYLFNNNGKKFFNIIAEVLSMDLNKLNSEDYEYEKTDTSNTEASELRVFNV